MDERSCGGTRVTQVTLRALVEGEHAGTASTFIERTKLLEYG